MKLLKVSSNSIPNSVAGAIAGVVGPKVKYRYRQSAQEH